MGQANYATPYTFTTFAGNAGYGIVDGAASAARFYNSDAIAADNTGNLYVADTGNNTIRKVTPAGVVTTLAGLAGNSGTNNGTGSAARFSGPAGVAVDGSGIVYVADSGNGTIRKVTPAGVVTTLAGLAHFGGTNDGTGSAARFSYPAGMAVDSSGNLYVSDQNNHTIRKVTPGGVVTTLAGLGGSTGTNDGTGSAARFVYPAGLAIDSSNTLYLADVDDNIRKVTLTGVVTTLAGLGGNTGTNDGTGTAARFNQPQGLAVDSSGNVFVADNQNSTIRKITPAGVVTTWAGSATSLGTNDGTGTTAQFKQPYGMAVDSANNVFVTDQVNQTIRKITPAAVVTTLAGLPENLGGGADGTGSAVQFYHPYATAVDSAGNVYIADYNNSTIRKSDPSGAVTTLAGLARSSGTNDGTGSSARFFHPYGLAVDNAGNIYVADVFNYTIRKVTPAGVVTTLAGLARSSGTNDGTGSAARFNQPHGVALDGAGNIYVGDTGNNTVRKVTAAGVVTTLAGLAGSTGTNDGTGSSAQFNQPAGLAVDSANNIYVADSANYTIRKITPARVVTTPLGLAGSSGSTDGTGNAARFYGPVGVAMDGAGNLYVVDAGNDTIRKVTSAGVVTTLAGAVNITGSADGTGNAARFYGISGLAVDGAGNLYVADQANNNVRKGFPASSLSAPVLYLPNLNAGQFGSGITGLPGLPVDILSSTDLSHWQVAGTYILNGGTNYFISPTPQQFTQFYRAHVR